MLLFQIILVTSILIQVRKEKKQNFIFYLSLIVVFFWLQWSCEDENYSRNRIRTKYNAYIKKESELNLNVL